MAWTSLEKDILDLGKDGGEGLWPPQQNQIQ